MSKGAIILISFPFTDLTGQKVRPALVLSVQKKGEDCVVVFISSQKIKHTEAFDIPIKASAANGLKLDSIIKVDKIATLQKKTAIGELGILEKSTLLLVDKKLKDLFQI